MYPEHEKRIALKLIAHRIEKKYPEKVSKYGSITWEDEFNLLHKDFVTSVPFFLKN